jgi:hypothetical protein
VKTQNRNFILSPTNPDSSPDLYSRLRRQLRRLSKRLGRSSILNL